MNATATPFIEEACRYVLSGQAMFYVNSREEDRCVKEIRHAGWLLADTGRAAAAMADAAVIAAVRHALTPEEAEARLFQAAAADPQQEPPPGVLLLLDAMHALDHFVPATEAEAAAVEAHKRALKESLDHVGYPTATWDMISGLDVAAGGLTGFVELFEGLANHDVAGLPSRCLVIIKDAHLHLGGADNAGYRRALRNCYEDNRLVRGDKLSRPIFFLQPYMRPHEDIRHCLVRLDFPLPDDAQIGAAVTEAQQSILDETRRHCPEELRVELVSSLRGLDSANIATTLARCLVDFKGFIPELVDERGRKRRMASRVRGMRSRMLSAGHGLRILDPDDPELADLGGIGGYDNVKDLAERVAFCRTPAARALDLQPPSGFAVAGVPGTGKTMVAKLFAVWLGLPLCVVNMGTLKEGIVGASEQNTDAAIKTISALGDCVVLFDEWDKQSSGIVGGGNTDGNTSSGMLSLILDFASDPRRRAFLIFTMNRLTGPIESLRSGRISRFFYTPLPDAIDREEILTLKLTEAKAAIPKDLKKVAEDKLTAELTGAELEEMVREAVALAAMRCGAKTPTFEDFQAARNVVTAVTRLDAEQIAAMTKFKDIAVPVSKPKNKARSVAQLGKRAIRFSPGHPENN